MPAKYFAQLSDPSGCAITVFELFGDKQNILAAAGIRKHISEGKIMLKQMRHRGVKFDEALAEYLSPASSFTGLDTIVMTVHGGYGISHKIKDMLNEAGFTELDRRQRASIAYNNGKIDYIQLEAIHLLETAQTKTQALFLSLHKDGLLSQKIHSLAVKEISGLLKRSQSGIRMSKVTNLVILGTANSGKSTLFNRLLSKQRSLALDHDGTTLDTVDDYTEIHGYPFRLFDTAGFKDNMTELDRRAFAQTKKYAAEADIVIWLFDATNLKEPPNEIKNIVNRPALKVLNKRDLSDSSGRFDVKISLKTGLNIGILVDLIVSKLGLDVSLMEDPAVPFTERQVKIISESKTKSKADLDSMVKELTKPTVPELPANVPWSG